MVGLTLMQAPLEAQEWIPPRPNGTGYANLPLDPESAPRPAARATRTWETIRVDGLLDEAAWGEAEPISDFIQSQPDVGQPPTEPTVVRILYDERGLYVGAICYESGTDALVVRSMERDFPGESTRNTDVFAITLDTFLDRRNSFMFLVNPLGGFRDDQTFNDSRQLDTGWDAVAEIRTAMYDSAWTVEMAIPWRTLRFDPGRVEQVWGLNLLRRIRRKLEDSYWAPLDRRDPVHRMSKAGTLIIGRLDDLETGRGLRVKPYGLTRSSPGDITDTGPLGGVLDGGLDLKYGLTSELTVDLSYNTEFSEAEVDQEQVNLTRFPLFFPEKREFFVENSGSFLFGDVAERNYRQGTSLRDFTLFHSRRIGLTPDRRPRPILGGARLSGRAGRFELGMLNMQTEEFEDLVAENFTVARVRGNIRDGTDIGAMFINRQATGGSGAYSRSYGADANIRLLGSMIINSYLAGTDTEEGGDADLAGRVSVSWRDRVWDASAMYKQVGEDFSPGTGFVRRTGIRHTYATLGAHPRPGLSWLFEVNPYAEVHYITDLENLLQTRELRGGLGLDLRGAGALDLTWTDRFERLADEFPVRSDVTVPAGDYGTTEWGLRYQSDQGRRLSGNLSLTTGDFWSGERTSLSLSGDWRVSPFLAIQASVSHNDVSLLEGAFTADVFGAQAKFAPTPWLVAATFVQYNEAAEELVTNVRFNFVHAPLSDFYLVFTERRSTGGGGALDRMITAKLTKLFEF
jgi:hypothetical protein